MISWIAPGETESERRGNLMKEYSKPKQDGIATVLIVLLIGISLTAATLGTVRFVGSAQEKNMAFHARTMAQARAWGAADLISGYLATVAEESSTWTVFEQDLLSAGGVLDIDLEDIDVSARIEGEPSPGNPVDLEVEIESLVAEGTRAEATERIRLAFHIIPPVTCDDETPDEIRGVIHFNKNLNLGGNITVQGISGQPYEINVKGDVNTGGNSITGVNTINSTGSVQLGSGSSFDTLRANGDVQLTGSVSGQASIQARGNVCVTGGASARGVVKANGTVIGDGSGSFGPVSAIGVSDNTGTQRCGTLVNDAYGVPFAVDLRGNSRADSVISKGSVRIASGRLAFPAARRMRCERRRILATPTGAGHSTARSAVS